MKKFEQILKAGKYKSKKKGKNGKWIYDYGTAGKGSKKTIQEPQKKSRTKTARNNDVKRIFAIQGWPKDNFIDPMTHGYRVHLGDWDEKKISNFEKELKKHNIKGVTFRKRTGYGAYAGKIDMIVPYSDDKEAIEWSKG